MKALKRNCVLAVALSAVLCAGCDVEKEATENKQRLTVACAAHGGLEGGFQAQVNAMGSYPSPLALCGDGSVRWK